MIRILNRYILSNFIIKFLYILLSFSLIFFILNIFEFSDHLFNSSISLSKLLYISIIKITILIQDLFYPIIFISSLVTLYALNNRNEIIIIRISKMPIVKILSPIIIAITIISIFYIFLIQPLFIHLNNNVDQFIKSIDNSKDEKDIIYKELWLYSNIKNDEGKFLIFNSSHNNPQKEILYDINIHIFNNHKLTKTINAKEGLISKINNSILLQDNIINDIDNNILNNHLAVMEFNDIDIDYILFNLNKNLNDIKSFNIYNLTQILFLNKIFYQIDINHIKYEYCNIIFTPIIAVIISIMSVFFAINNNRSKKSILLFFIGILFIIILHVFLLFIDNYLLLYMVNYYIIFIFKILFLSFLSVILLIKKEYNI